jgi:hypothetical protein
MHIDAEGPQSRLHKGVATDNRNGKWAQPFPRTRRRLAPHCDILRRPVLRFNRASIPRQATVPSLSSGAHYKAFFMTSRSLGGTPTYCSLTVTPRSGICTAVSVIRLSVNRYFT